MKPKNCTKTLIKSSTSNNMNPFLPKTTAPDRQHFFFVLLFSFMVVPFAYTQEKIISGEGSVLHDNPSKTKQQFEFEAYQAAIQNALENAFGSTVISNYERLTQTEMQGRSVASYNDIRNNYLNTYPNGIWTKDQSVEYFEEKDARDHWWTICRVTGSARQMEAAKVRFIARTLDGTDPLKNQTETFISGETGYLYFRSAEPGHIIVFYDDMKAVQRCIPYNAGKGFDLGVDANRDYLFFSQELANYIENKNVVDEIEFSSDIPMDYNQFIVVFAPTPFKGYFLNDSESLEDGYSTFKSMNKDEFHTWLQENRARNKDLQVQIIGVTIRGVEKK
jgi:hypothetical protein